MASLFKNPVQALMGQNNSPNAGPLSSAEAARDNPDDISWESVSGIDPRWVNISDDIDATRWNRSYPYQLMILERVGGGYNATKYKFTLPIAPTDMSISTPFAISTAVTLGGIVEEHNGAPLRTITFAGTTGVTPLRGSAQGAKQANVLQGIFAGTVQSVTNLVTDSKSLTGISTAKPNLVDNSQESFLEGTGYMQFRLLQRFLESYVTLKKAGKGQLRLGLAIWKDEAIYLVTPQDFTVHRSASSPWEYSYNLIMKAWGRISLSTPGADPNDAFKPVARDANAFAQLLNKVTEARRVLQAARDVLSAAQQDVDKLITEPLREVTLFCKDALNVVTTAADLPLSIIQDLKPAILGQQSLYAQIASGFGDDLQGIGASYIKQLGVESGKAETKDGSSGSTGTGTNQDPLNGAHPGNKIFDNPQDYFDLFDKIKPSELNLSPETQRKINDEKERVRNLTRLDFENTRDSIQEFQAQFADAVGAGSPDYDAVYGRRTVTSTKTPTQDDFDALFALNQTIMQLNSLAASGTIGKVALSTVDAVAGMASAAGIAFTVPVSKFAVPFPYGSTLEQLSGQYLGDPNRWHEIVALNGLRQPFVDEEGFDLPLLVNGRGNQVTVSDPSNLLIGQPVLMSSTNTSRSSRRIVKIDRISAGTTVITVDGDPDLDRYTTLGQAVLHAWLPDTVNSQQLIYIPSQIDSGTEDFFTKSIPGVDEFDQLIQVGGTDLLLTSNGDLAVTADGDCRLSTGLTNIIQRIRIALGTPKGSLLHHPDFGLGLVVGVSTADLDTKQMLATLQDMFRSDPAFSGVSGVSILKSGPSVRVAMTVAVTGTNQTIPLTVDIKR